MTCRIEDSTASSYHAARTCILPLAAEHGVRLAGAGLAVAEERHVEPVQRRLHKLPDLAPRAWLVFRRGLRVEVSRIEV